LISQTPGLSVISWNIYCESPAGVLFFFSSFDSANCGDLHRSADGDEIFSPENAPKMNIYADQAIHAVRPCLSDHLFLPGLPYLY
jgi:hypothetical protein